MFGIPERKTARALLQRRAWRYHANSLVTPPSLSLPNSRLSQAAEYVPGRILNSPLRFNPRSSTLIKFNPTKELPMKMFGRNITLRRFVEYSFAFPGLIISSVRLTKSPFSIVYYYIRRLTPKTITLRSGHTIHMGGHPHDIVTFFVVFIRRDYGIINPGSVVLDIGANIGIFALYAALGGARRVYSFEPNEASFALLKKNLEDNGFSETVIPINKAMAGTRRTVWIPASSSPYNAISTANLSGMQEIEAITLASFIEESGIEKIDLLKMDCEGAEYEIVPSLDAKTLDIIEEIRMECHGSKEELVSLFRSQQMRVTQSHGSDLWLRNISCG